MNITCSIPQLAGLFCFAHNLAQSGFKSSRDVSHTSLLRHSFHFVQSVPERGLEHYMFNTPIGWISSLRFAPFLIQLNRASSPQVMCPTHHFSGTAFTSFNLCRREDLNLHALRHTHLKRTWLPITPLRQWLIV